jgi:hypothetical protein
MKNWLTYFGVGGRARHSVRADLWSASVRRAEDCPPYQINAERLGVRQPSGALGWQICNTSSEPGWSSAQLFLDKPFHQTQSQKHEKGQAAKHVVH